MDWNTMAHLPLEDATCILVLWLVTEKPALGYYHSGTFFNQHNQELSRTLIQKWAVLPLPPMEPDFTF